MSKNSRPVLLGALILILLSSGCGVLTRGAPTPVWTVPPQGTAQIPTPTLPAPVTPTGTAVTPVIPLTGENVVALQCQFCVDAETHAILVFPDSAYFDVSEDSGVSCLTADVVNGRRILICRGPQATSFNLNICSDPSNCMQFPVALQPCPLLQAGATPPLATYTPNAPVYLTPVATFKPTKKATRTPTLPAETTVPSSPSPGTPTATLPAYP